MTLYEIDQAIYELLSRGFAIDEETGEVLDGAEELEQLQMERSEKLESVALYIKSLDAFIKSIKAEEEVLAKRRKKTEDKVERLKKYLTNAIIGNGENSFESAKVSVSFRKSEGVEVTDKSVLDEKYWRVNTTTKREPDKNLIKETIKSGVAVTGAILETRQNINIL